LIFDVLQLSFLLYFTGGLANPFCLLLIVPVTIAGTTLPVRYALGVTLLAAMCAIVIVMSPKWIPNPFVVAGPLTPNRIAKACALVFSVGFAGGFAAWAAAEGRRMVLALQVTESVLAREQKLTALDGLAAAAAHELGTPLATITVVAKELARETPQGARQDDALLLVEQAERCRDILKRLSHAPDITDAMYERITLTQFIGEILSPYHGQASVRTEGLVTGTGGTAAPDIWRKSEVTHAVTAFVENAFDFARSEILLVARYDAKWVTIEVCDDGPGIDAEIRAKLGEPYVTSRPGAEGSRTGHVGMGLGFFIAKTLLERTGASVEANNIRGGGAIISAQWPRGAIEAVEGENMPIAA
jgi:two-component system sensor histidine kinase RegB